MPSDESVYDRGISLFAPDGKLSQVEHARNAIFQALPVAGIRTEDSVILVSQNTETDSNLLVKDTFDKVYRIDEQVTMTAAGHVTDARKLAEKLRGYVSDEMEKYGGLEDVKTLIFEVSEHVQEVTQNAMQRPYGVSLIIGGINHNNQPSLYRVEPDGTPSEWRAVASGRNQEDVIRHMESNYSSEVSDEEATRLVLEALSDSSENELKPEFFTVSVMNAGSGYHEKSTEEIARIMESMTGDEDE